MNSILYHLMHNPAAYEKLTAEIDTAVADGMLSMPATYAEAVKLPYLEACINEGMRLHPSVGLTMPRLVPASGETIPGFYFPEGYRVGVNGAIVQYDKDVFGPDADDFNPDRWIKGDAVRMIRTMFHFGVGPRTCIGKNINAGLCTDFSIYANTVLQISLSEIYNLVPQIIRVFYIGSQTRARSGKRMIIILINRPIFSFISKSGRRNRVN